MPCKAGGFPEIRTQKAMSEPETYGPIRRLRLRTSHALKRHPELYLSISRQRYKPYRGAFGAGVIASEAVGCHTDVVIEGPPRSGNTFAVVAFQLAQERPASVAHHLHAAPQVVAAAAEAIPAVVLLRQPEDAIMSNVVSFGVPIDMAFREYIQFYQDVLAVRDHFVVAEFKTLVSNYGAVISRLNGRFGTRFRLFDHTQENVARCFETIDAHYQARSKPAMHAVARPSSTRRTRKDAQRAGFWAARYAGPRKEVERLYQDLASTKI